MDINEIIKQVTEEVYKRLGEKQGGPAGEDSPAAMAKYIDHTILKPGASLEDVRKICEEAKKYKFASVCVNPSYIKFVAENLQGSGVAPCCVVGFPLGASTPRSQGQRGCGRGHQRRKRSGHGRQCGARSNRTTGRL